METPLLGKHSANLKKLVIVVHVVLEAHFFHGGKRFMNETVILITILKVLLKKIATMCFAKQYCVNCITVS
jgi:hypothetical protein